jgi:hypothetical protein
MAQTLLTPTIITRESLEILENQLCFANLVNRRFENYFHKIGTQLTIRKPNRFLVSDGPALQIQEIQEPSVVVTVNKQKHVDFEFSSADMALTVEEMRERYLKPAMSQLANQVDFDVAANWSAVNNVVGTAGTTPSTYANSVALTGRRLDENAAPQESRSLVLNPAAYWSIVAGQSNAFVTRVSEKALIKGYIAEVGNQSIYMDQNIQSSTASVYGGTPLTNAATAQTGASLITDGWTATTTVLTVGTVFTIDGVFAVNPQNRTSTGNLMNFTVTVATATDGGGNSTIAISPAIIATGPFQNVTNGAANNKAITVLTGLTTATSANNLAFCKDAFGLIMVPMPIPNGVHAAARETYKGISMRYISDYDGINDIFYTRMDLLYGTTTYYPELAVRLLG